MFPIPTPRRPLPAAALLALSWSLCWSSLFATAAGARAQGQPEPVPVAPASAAHLAAFDVLAGTVQQLEVTATENGDHLTRLVLGGEERTLVLQPYEVRAPGFRLVVEDATGQRTLPTPPSVTYRGFLLEDAASFAVATVTGGVLTALIRRPVQDAADEVFGVQALREVDPGAAADAYLVYRTSDNAPLPWTCGTTGTVAVPPPPVGLDVNYECEIALEADVPFYQLNGSSVTATQNDITGIVNAMSTIYLRDVSVQFRITQIIVNTGVDPYSSSSAGTLLSQFGNRWNQVHAGVQRDLAHLFTGRNLSGSTIGIAILGALCNRGSAYGLSQSRFSTNYSRRVGLTAHEIGHTFSAPHCDGSSPCYIMCSGLGGCSGSVTQFAPVSQNRIRSFSQSVGCLTPIPTTPVIQSVTPGTVTVFRPDLVTLSGTGFVGTTQLQVGTTTMTSGFSVINDQTLRFTPPDGTQLGQVSLRATNAAGPSNVMNLNYSFTTPCKLEAPGIVVGGTSANFLFAGRPGFQYFLLVSLGSTTAPFQGLPVLSGASVLSAGVFDATLGLGGYSIPVPPLVLNGLLVHTQVVEASALLMALTSTSAVDTTFILN